VAMTFGADVYEAVRRAAHTLGDAHDGLEPILRMVGADTRFVLVGEASHGTHEFYALRAELTKRLILEHGFAAVAVEADWPDADRVNRFVRGLSRDATPEAALGGFERFPRWMWRNADVVEFLSWLRAYNEALEAESGPVGFYGLDLYSLHASIAAVLEYLDRTDPEAAQRARVRYGCFDQFGEDPQTYGLMTTQYRAESCEEDVVDQLLDLQRRAAEAEVPEEDLDARFAAEQNARLVANAEAYYRAMFRGREDSWNLRDRHMAETLDLLTAHLERPGRPARVVVWAHNSHLGDARATENLQRGQLNVGQLVREGYGRDALLVGFTTHGGWVTAASDWGGAAECKRVRPALTDSYEALFHGTGLPRFVLPLRDGDPAAVAFLRKPRLERAIGVIYRPETERWSHYFYARLPDQFDAVIHIDQTQALVPLERTAQWERGELPETFPSAL
jgi:erythromycin esterase-like protein